MSALARFVGIADTINEYAGRLIAWVVLAMVLVAFSVVVLRYGFSIGFIWLQESYVWMHGLIFMIGAGYTLLHDGHVRVDVFYRGRSAKYQAWVNLVGVIVLLLPVTIVVFWVSVPYVLDSWSRLEASRETGGLPGLFLMKTAIWVFCFLLALQGLSLAARSFLILRGHEEFRPKDEAHEFA